MEKCYAYYDENGIVGCLKTRFPNRVLLILKLATENENLYMKDLDIDESCDITCPRHLDCARTNYILRDYNEKVFKKLCDGGFEKMKELAIAGNLVALQEG